MQQMDGLIKAVLGKDKSSMEPFLFSGNCMGGGFDFPYMGKQFQFEFAGGLFVYLRE